MEQTVQPGRLAGTVAIPASKSHTIRALLIASLADGRSVLRSPLDSQDARSCISVCRQFGAAITAAGDDLIVEGTGGTIRVPHEVVDVGNSGTTLFLATALAALADKPVLFDGDEQTRARSAGNLLAALEGLGAKIERLGTGDCVPYKVCGPLRGGKVSIECPTSQYLSSLLLACPLARGSSEISVPLLYEAPYAGMTLWWLEQQGLSPERHGMEWFRLQGGGAFKPFDMRIPGDFSSAGFFLCAAALAGKEVRLTGLDMNDTQGDKEVVAVLERMGAVVRHEGKDIVVSAAALSGIDIDMNAIPDALPVLAATAVHAKGTTRLLNVPQARMKETDRIDAMTRELRKMGAKVEELPDGMVIEGGVLSGARVHGHHDHRVVMALAVTALRAKGQTTIDTAEAAAVTYPDFFNHLEQLRSR